MRHLLGFAKDQRIGAQWLRRLLRLWPKSILIEALIELRMESPPGDWFRAYRIAGKEIERLNALLENGTPFRDSERRRGQHMADLELKNAKLKSTVREMQKCAERHNAEAYATGLIVRCTGCQAGAPDHWEDLTEEKVVQVEVIASRLRSWWNNRKMREQREGSMR